MVLTVSALAFGCPSGDDTETANEEGPATTTGTTEGTTASEAATASETTTGTSGMTGSTGLDTGGTTDAPSGCTSLPDLAACSEDPACVWGGPDVGCQINCFVIEDQATCEATGICFWVEDQGCYFPV
jgi:hypothetical protein